MIPVIDTDRLWARLMQLAEIGALPGGGKFDGASATLAVEHSHVVAGAVVLADVIQQLAVATSDLLAGPGRKEIA